jgi:uncharacterized membrane protein
MRDHVRESMRAPKVGVSALSERLRGSLFVVPTVYVVVGIALGEAGVSIDRLIDNGNHKLPLGLTSTVASARSVLSTIAGATITVAGIAFSVSLLTIQLASNQYSPRVVSGLFRDPFNKRVIGIVVGTFSYCLIVLRAVRSPVEQQGQAVIPNVSVALAVVFGIVTVMAIVAFINHNAHAMEVSEILGSVSRAAIASVGNDWSVDALEPSPAQRPDDVPEGASLRVSFTEDGWFQLLDHGALLDAAPEGGTVRLETAVGRYVYAGSPFCTIWPVPTDPERSTRRAHAAVRVGGSRTLRQDAGYGIRQLADVALKALSPGVNDPTTAQDAIFHIGSVLRAFLDRDPPARDLYDGNRRLVLPEAAGYERLLTLAYAEIRRAAATQPTVCVYLLESIDLVAGSLPADRRAAAWPHLHREAELILHASEDADVRDPEIERVREVFARHFGPDRNAVGHEEAPAGER